MCAVTLFSSFKLSSAFRENIKLFWDECSIKKFHYNHTTNFADQMNAACNMSWVVWRMGTSLRLPELHAMQLGWMWPAFSGPWVQFWGSKTALYRGNIGLKYGLKERKIVAFIPKITQQIQIGWAGLKSTTVALDKISNNGVHPSVLVHRRYHTMHLIVLVTV